MEKTKLDFSQCISLPVIENGKTIAWSYKFIVSKDDYPCTDDEMELYIIRK